MISTEGPLKVTIDSYDIDDNIVHYSVTVSTTGNTKSWTVLKRFSNFDELHCHLSKSFSAIPPRPKKTLFKMKSPKDIEKRRKDLEEYSNKLLANKELFNNSLVKSFFGIESHASEFTANQAISESLISKRILANPVSKLLFNSKTNMIITVEKLVSKDKTKNVNLLKSFKFKSSPALKEDAPDESMWDFQLNAKITCIAQYVANNTLAFGADSGLVYIQPLLKSGELEASKDPIPAHTGAVTGICFEENEVYVISVGADKRVVGITLDGKLLYSSKIGEHVLTSVNSDGKNGRIAITNSNGELFICDIKTLKIVVLQSFKLTYEISILSSRLSCSRNIIVCLLPGEIRWYEYGEQKKELGNWKVVDKITCWELYENKNFLVVGNKKGNLIFLNLATGIIKYELQTHTDSIKSLFIDQSSGTIITSSKELPLCAKLGLL